MSIFFFSSRRRHTRLQGDWSSDVCSSDLNAREIDIEKELDLKWQLAHWIGICICRAAPPDMVVGLGSNYERLFIIPSLNVIIVRQGWSAKFSDAYFLRLALGR